MKQIQPTQCKHCRFSEGRYAELANVVFCVKHGTTNPKPCDDYDREPGADDE